MDQPIVEELHIQPENQPPPPVENQPPVLQNQPPPVQAAATGQGNNRPAPQHKQEDIGLTYLRQQENEPVDQYLHRALNYNKTNSVSEQFLVKLAYRGLKPQIQQIVVPQNPVSMSDLLSKSITAEMTVNMVQPQQSSVENSILKAVSSIEDKIMDKIFQRLDYSSDKFKFQQTTV
ncbi:unnamed protein product [Mytilus edulis]|uniref:Uncharacterized protein n=1 Tax=Mytilus edulis TaxID=6550 RepID=A0A8S3RGF0_MYTED|nr:unnamed protein product [Mytilus edulis]